MPHRLAPLLLSLTVFAGFAAAPLAAQDPAADAPAVAPASSGAPLTLDEALRLAEQHSETAGIAAARVEQAQAVLRQAYAAVMPDLTFSGTYTRRSRSVEREVGGENVTIQAIDAMAGQLNLDATLFDLRVVPLVRAARHEREAQTLLSNELRRALAFDVATSFYGVLGTERLHEAAVRRTGQARAVVDDASQRLEAGLAARNEVTRSELEQATAELAETQAAADVRTARLGLELLLGVAIGDRPLVEPGGAAPDAAAPTPSPTADAEALAAEARRRREDLQALDAQILGLAERAKEPSLRFLPTLDGRVTYRGTNEPGLSGRREDWNAAAFLTWEIFDGGTRSADRALREAQLAEARLNRTALDRRIASDVQTALADVTTARAALAQAEARVRVATQNSEEVRERFRAGLASALEQADAAVAAFEAEAGLARQRFLYDTAALRLRETLGDWPLPIAADAAGAEPAAAATPAATPDQETSTP